MRRYRIPSRGSHLLDRLVSYGERVPEPNAELSPHVVIRAIRNGLRLTQAQLAKRAGMPQSHLAKIETGKVDLQFSTLQRILRAMHCEPVVLPKFRKPPQPASVEPARVVVGKKIEREDGLGDLRFWLSQSPRARIEAVESLRRQVYLVTGQKVIPRIVRAARIMDSRP